MLDAAIGDYLKRHPEDVEKIVKDYLMAHPEIVEASISAMIRVPLLTVPPRFFPRVPRA